jgi:hypothetical protein
LRIGECLKMEATGAPEMLIFLYKTI